MSHNAYLPIRMPIMFIDEDEIKKEFKKILLEIQNLTDRLEFEFEEKQKMTFSIIDDRSKIKSLTKSHNIRTYLGTVGLLKISVNLPKRKASETNKRLDLEYFIKSIQDFVLAVKIAKHAFINFTEGVAFTGKQKEKIDVGIDSLELSFEHSKNLRWPKLELIDIEKTWNWLMKFQFSVMSVSNSNIGRAINAFSYVVNSTNRMTPDELVWAMIGIEAIYADGNVELASQLDVKTQLLLGERKTYKKRFRELYEYRSKFLHGKEDFPGHNYFSDGTDEFSAYFDESIDHISLSISTLLATLQQLVIQDIFSISFLKEYTLKKNA